jgi:hypothetical protein
MFKHLMNGASLIAIALRDADNENGADDGLTDVQRARAKMAANVKVTSRSDKEPVKEAAPDPEEDGEGDEGEDDEKEETDITEETEELDADGNPVVKEKETPEQKAAREATETAADKEARKQERIQKRIDKAVAGQRVAEAEVLKLKEQLAAKPDGEKLTEAEVQARAEAIAAEKVAAKDLANLQADFDKACNKLQTEAIKLDKDFTPKVVAMAEELGPIPSRIIGILSDLDNGAEVLKLMVDDIDEAEKIYDLKDKPERLAIALVRISDRLAAAKKPKPKEISKVPDPVTPVKGSRVQSLQITEADTKPGNMETYIQKRIRQREELKKTRGY